jgi:prepilin-type N-terminal cleavage/methylation domain-containing protein
VIERIKARLASGDGFSLVELVVVLNILGILTVIAVPAYIGFRNRADGAAASANVRSAVLAAESYYASPAGGNGSYTGLSSNVLRAVAPGIDPGASFKAGPNVGKDGYCIEDTTGPITYSYTGGIGGTAFLNTAHCAGLYTVA